MVGDVGGPADISLDFEPKVPGSSPVSGCSKIIFQWVKCIQTDTFPRVIDMCPVYKVFPSLSNMG